MTRQCLIETFPVPAVKDEWLPEAVHGFDELPGLTRAILDNCPVVTQLTYDGAEPTLPFDGATDITNNPEPGHYSLAQATPNHGRSFMVTGKHADRHWQDEFNNEYGTLTLKGNNFSHTQLIETATAVDRYIAYGLQESAVIRRVLRASRMLRSAQIGTEYVVGLAEPTEYLLRRDGDPIKQQPVPLDEYKQALIEKHWRSLPDDDRTFDAYLDISQKLERSTFYISLRATDTPYRYQDVQDDLGARQAVYKVINQHHLKEDDTPLDPLAVDDLERYTKDYFAPKLAQNIARLHGLKLAHRFPNALNVSALGSLVDLDSVHGEPLDLADEPITYVDMAEDILMAFRRRTIGSADLPDGYVEAYFTELDLHLDPTEATRTKLEIAAACSEIQWADHAPAEQLSDNEEVFAAVIAAEVIDPAQVSNIITDKQIGAEVFSKEVGMYIQNNLERFTDWLLYDSLLEFPEEVDQPDFDPIAKLYAEDGRFAATLSYDLIMRDVLHGVANQLCGDYLAEHLQTALRPGIKLDDLSPAAQLLAGRYFLDIGKAAGQIELLAYLNTLDNLRKQAEAIKDLCRSGQSVLLFQDEASSSLPFTTSNHLLIHETVGVPLSSVLNYAEQNNIELGIRALDHDTAMYPRPDYEASEDGELVQVITNAPMDGWQPDFGEAENGLRITSLVCDSTNSEYFVFVEDLVDGNKRFVLALKDGQLASRLSGLSAERVYETLRQEPIAADRLFDDTPYIEDPEIIHPVRY